MQHPKSIRGILLPGLRGSIRRARQAENPLASPAMTVWWICGTWKHKL